LDILVHDSTLQKQIVPKVLIEMPAHTNSFIFAMALLRQIGFYGLCSGQHPSRWLRQAGWRAAGPRIRLSCAGPARRAKSVSIQQQPATRAFQVAGCFSIWQECAATFAPPRLASQRTSVSQRSMLMHGPATSWRGRGGRLVQRRTYVTNLLVEQ
jgi:hypothetical protein